MQISRRLFYFEAQKGICALMITERCRNVGGAMLFDGERIRGRIPRREASWDHVYPRQQRRDTADEDIQLLACSECNNRRGCKPPTPEYIARGMDLLERYRQRVGEDLARAELKRHRRKERAYNRRLIRAMQTQPELAEAVEQRRAFSLLTSYNALRKQYQHGFPKPDDPPPRTVAEALAQGGLIAPSLSKKKMAQAARHAANAAAIARRNGPKGWSLERERALAIEIRAARLARESAAGTGDHMSADPNRIAKAEWEQKERARRNAESQAAARRGIEQREKEINQAKRRAGRAAKPGLAR